jgi:hypothetical protein
MISSDHLLLADDVSKNDRAFTGMRNSDWIVRYGSRVIVGREQCRQQRGSVGTRAPGKISGYVGSHLDARCEDDPENPKKSASRRGAFVDADSPVTLTMTVPRLPRQVTHDYVVYHA